MHAGIGFSCLEPHPAQELGGERKRNRQMTRLGLSDSIHMPDGYGFHTSFTQVTETVLLRIPAPDIELAQEISSTT
jgi:hypothetical protein